MPAFIPIVYGVAQPIMAAQTSQGAAISQVFVAPNDYPVTLTPTLVGVFSVLTFNIVTILPTGDQVTVATWDAHAGTAMTFSMSRNVPYQIVCTGFTGGTSVAVNAVLVTTQTVTTAAQPVSLSSLPALAAGSALIGGINTQPSTAATAACSTKAIAGLTVSNVKASAGNLYGLTISNTSAATVFLQFYNTAGTPVLGTSVIFFIACPVGVTNVPVADIALANFTTGIGIGASTTATSTGTPTVAPNVTVFFS